MSYTTWGCSICDSVHPIGEPCSCKPAPPPAIEATRGDELRVDAIGGRTARGEAPAVGVPARWWSNPSEVRSYVDAAYARGLADAAEAIAAWLDEEAAVDEFGQRPAAGDLAAMVRNGAWREHLKKGT